VFLVNRRLGLVTAAPSRSAPLGCLTLHGAPLLPKLRGQFAEFLDSGCLVHLGLLDQPTCVGLRYGRARSRLAPKLEAFLGGPASIPTVRGRPLPLHSPLRSASCRICLARLPTGLEELALPGPSPPRPPIAPSRRSGKRIARGTGILTRCPSPTARALGLGPPHPQLISMAAEPLGIRWGGFAPPSRYSCRHSHSPPLHRGSHRGFSADGDAPLPWQNTRGVYHPRLRSRA
jgi:hypothetical protein